MATSTRGARTAGYIVAIVIDLVLLYVAQHAVEWSLPWLTPAWFDVLWAVNLSLGVSIVGYALLVLYDAGWFHSVVEVFTTGAALLSGYWVYVVFPFEFGAWSPLAHLAMVMVLVGLAIATVVLVVVATIQSIRAAWRQLAHAW